jgi:hypothetical protein
VAHQYGAPIGPLSALSLSALSRSSSRSVPQALPATGWGPDTPRGGTSGSPGTASAVQFRVLFRRMWHRNGCVRAKRPTSCRRCRPSPPPSRPPPPKPSGSPRPARRAGSRRAPMTDEALPPRKLPRPARITAIGRADGCHQGIAVRAPCRAAESVDPVGAAPESQTGPALGPYPDLGPSPRRALTASRASPRAPRSRAADWDGSGTATEARPGRRCSRRRTR